MPNSASLTAGALAYALLQIRLIVAAILGVAEVSRLASDRLNPQCNEQ
jgi:hypothetical protein